LCFVKVSTPIPLHLVSVYIRVVSPAEILELAEETRGLIHFDEASALVDHIYAVDASEWDDEQFSRLESIIDKAIAVLSAAPSEQTMALVQRLLTAREGVVQGLSPDPAKRPSPEELRHLFSAYLS
jgi:hypothetical protein